jgi:hypothetical protein
MVFVGFKFFVGFFVSSADAVPPRFTFIYSAVRLSRAPFFAEAAGQRCRESRDPAPFFAAPCTCLYVCKWGYGHVKMVKGRGFQGGVFRVGVRVLETAAQKAPRVVAAAEGACCQYGAVSTYT